MFNKVLFLREALFHKSVILSCNTGTQATFMKLYQIRRPLGLVFVIYFCLLGELLLLYI
jgi:hypothetical protein